MFTIKLPGPPVPQARPRVTRYGTYDPLKKKKEVHRLYIRSFYPALEPFKEAIFVSMCFEAEFPKSTPKYKKKKRQFKASRADLDNYVKYFFDMANGLLWADDSLIVGLTAVKLYSEENGTTVAIVSAKEMEREYGIE